MKLFRAINFIIISGVISGIVMSINLWFSNFIGYYAFLTHILLLFILFIVYINYYKRIFKKDISISAFLLFGLISTLISVLIFQFLSEIINSNKHYTTFGRLELLKEGITFSLVFTSIFGLIFLPLYRVITAKRKGR